MIMPTSPAFRARWPAHLIAIFNLNDALSFIHSGAVGRPDEKELYRRLRQLQGWVKQEGSRVRNDTWIYARYTKESWVPGV